VITIQELLRSRGLTSERKAKLVRHKDNRMDLYNLYRYNRPAFLEYQRGQVREVFKGVELIVVFIGEEGRRARFVGVYRILGGKKIAEKNFYYDIEEAQGFEDLKERVIIDWGPATIQWQQWISNPKEIIEIHPGLHYQQFTDYFDFILDFRQLSEIVNNQYSDWKRMLSVTKGIYLISDTRTGKLYVGSAYGDEGIWGRWVSYVATRGHGNNKTLKELIAADELYGENFRFSILMLLPRTITADQAIEKEKLFKKKLGTNSFGLNNN